MIIVQDDIYIFSIGTISQQKTYVTVQVTLRAKNMNTNSRFTIAIHILTILAYKQYERVTSAMISKSVTTNPVVIRRLLGDLKKAGLVLPHKGSHGGWELKRNPQDISLRDVYTAVSGGGLFSLHHQLPNQDCLIGKTIQSTLKIFFQDAEDAMTTRLQESTIADVLKKISC